MKSSNSILFYFLGILLIYGCQKDFKFNDHSFVAKQVFISNFTPNNKLNIFISKSKSINDNSPIEYLNNCEVKLYENNIFIEQLKYKVSDSASMLGFYYSTQKLNPNKTYLIISKHPQLGTASAEEYLPNYCPFTYSLVNHADSLTNKKNAQLTIAFRDSFNFINRYYLSVFYTTVTIKVTNGDTVRNNNWITNIPLSSANYANPFSINRIYFTDQLFDGFFHSLTFHFPSTYVKNAISQELYFELAEIGTNYYYWYSKQVYIDESEFNQGAKEPANAISNVQNGYGHFSGSSSFFQVYHVK